MSLFFLLNPKNFGYDQADVYVKARKYRALKREEEREEEALAAKLLRERLQESLLPQNVNPAKLASELVQPVQENPATALSPARLKRVKMILILMIADII